MTTRISWDFCPDPKLPWVPILSPKIGQVVLAWCLDERVLSVGTHFWDGRTQPHVEPASMCDGCMLYQQTIRWKGYLGGCLPETGRLVIMEITYGAYQHSPEVASLDQSQRGRLLRVWRLGAHRNGPVRVRVERVHPKPDELPASIDLRPHLLRAWGVEELLRVWQAEGAGRYQEGGG